MEMSTAGASSTDTSDTQPSEQKRTRRWHHRGFTGCSTCRRRHVRCDEASPACNNCVRLGRQCDGAQGQMTFKVYGPSQKSESRPQSRSGTPNRRGKSSVASPESSDNSALSPSKKEGDLRNCKDVVISPTSLPQPTVQFRFQDPVTPASVTRSIQRTDELYLAHFVDRVSTLLIIYDIPDNANPYRTLFPDFAKSSPTMINAMQALGALHLANTSEGSQRDKHSQTAMGKYGLVVRGFRARYADPSQQLGLTDFATCLLLCLFEVSLALSMELPIFSH